MGSTGVRRAPARGAGRFRRLFSLGACASLVLALATVPVLATAPPAAADSGSTIELAKSGPGTVLAGHPATFTLTATNPAGDTAKPQYNTSFNDVLPPGVTYKGGSTRPSDVGDPKIITTQVEFPAGSGTLVPQQTLIWSNVADLPISGDLSLSYQVLPDPDLYPVGSSFDNQAQAVSSVNPRAVPKFDKAGRPILIGPNVSPSPVRSVTTDISAITITKSDDASPEGTLLRGVHDEVAIYSLHVVNNDQDRTTGLQVVDYLPANLEFLGCGDTDDSSAEEYPGSGPLGQGRQPKADCLKPDTVETVTDPAPLKGVYTKVTWTIRDLKVGEDLTISYAAAIPLLANTEKFSGGTPDIGGAQGSNLDNNNGASTRQEGAGQAVTNTASVSGTYRGPTASDPDGTKGTPVSNTDTHTVTAKDVRVLKTVSTDGSEPGKQGSFAVNQIATYSLEVSTSEYTSAQEIVLSDRLANGLCPIVSQDQWDQLVTDHPSLATVQGCVADPKDPRQLPVVDTGEGITYSRVAFDEKTGEFTFTFSALNGKDPLDPQKSLHVSYPVRMLPLYPGGALAGTSTSTGDVFDNTVSMTAITTPIDGTGETGPVATTDSSSAELVTTAASIAKLIKPQPVIPATDYSCDGDGYVDPTNPVLQPARTTFAFGDLVCFELRVTFPAGTPTRNAVVADFLPAGTTYVAGSATLAPDNTVPEDQVTLDDSGATGEDGTLTWALGHPDAGALLVDSGQTFVVRLAVRVTTVPADPGSVDLTGNLMKFRAQNSEGKAVALRQQVNFALAPAIPLVLTKGVATVNGLPKPENPADTDHQQVKQGDLVDFRVDITHQGDADLGNDRPVSNLTVWDVLPAPFSCADLVVSATDGQECRNPDALGGWNPTVTGRPIIRWTIPGPLAAGDTTRLDYTLTVPEIGPNVDAINTASVSSYAADANDGAGATVYHPADNIDGDIPVADQLVPAVADSSDVFTAVVAAGKSVTSAIAVPGNDGAGQGAVGEIFTFTLTARIPAGLTVKSGSIQDVLPPAGLELLNTAFPPTAALAPDAANPGATTDLPGGFSLDPVTGVLTFPDSYSNATATDQLIVLTLHGRFTTAVGGHGTTLTNTSRFTWTPVGGRPTTIDAGATVTVVEPKPTLVKNVVTSGPYKAGQTITYQLAAGNTAGRPPAYDTWVVDCAPAGLTVTGYQAGSPTLGSTDDPVAGTGTGPTGNGCAVGTTRIGWHVGDLAGGVTGTLFYTATISSSAAAGQSYKNSAALSAVSIPGTPRPTPGATPPDGSRSYTATTNKTIQVTVPTLTKTGTPTVANVGAPITYTVTVSIPADVNLYNAVIRDLLPPGLDATSLTTVSIDCEQTPGSCTVPLPTPTTTASGQNTLVTWGLGDLVSQQQVRTITLVYSAKIADIPAVKAGSTIVNGAAIEWNKNPGGGLPPFNAGDIGNNGKFTVTATEPVVHVKKAVSNTTPEPGQTFAYTLTATNGGQPADANVGPAYSVVIADQVPAGVIIDPGSLPAGTALTGQNPDGSGGTLTWSIPGPLQPGTANAVSVTYQAKLAASGTLTAAGQKNTATVTDVYSQPSGTGRHTAGDSATATVTPDFPKIVPTKTAVTTGPAYAGTPFTWQLTLKNSGTGRAYGVSAVDVLPPHWAYRTGSALVTVGNGSPAAIEPTITAAAAPDGPTLTWSGLAPLGTPATTGLAPGQSIVITFDATPDDTAPTPAGSAAPNTNRVTATATDATGATGNKTGTYTPGTGSANALIHAADLVMTKTAGAFTAGGSGSWTLTASNDGPDTAVGPVLVTDTIPATLTLPAPGGAGAPLTLVSATGTGWSCQVDQDTRVVTCARTAAGDTLPAGDSFPPITVRVGVPADAVNGSTVTNAGTFEGRTFDPDPDNNTDSATGTVATQADLSLVKSLDGPLVAGDTATYELNLTNLGPSVSLASAVSPITITDTLPAGTTFVSVLGLNWSCDPPVAGVLRCDYTRTLLPSASAPTLRVRVAIPADRTADVVNSATVTPGGTPDPVPGNNTDSVTTTPTLSADLLIAKTLVGKAVNPPVAGTDREYQFTVVNFGPSDSTGVVVTDTLPASVTSNGTWTSVTGTWTCVTAGQQVTCSLSGAIPGPTNGIPHVAIVRISVHIANDHNTADPIINTATVTADTPDPDPKSNTDTDNSSITAEADLSIEKTITTADVVAGRPMTYQLQVHNLGPSQATGTTTVRDYLPDGLSFDPANPPSGTGWTCTISNDQRSVECTTTDPIAPEPTKVALAPPIDVPVLVAEDAIGPLTNVATVTGDLTDPDPTNNLTERETPIRELADVSITKTAAAHTVTAGTDVTYALEVVNHGPSTARGLAVVDTPEPGLVITGLTGAGWDCTVATLTCTRDELTVADGTSTITVTAHPIASVPAGTTLDNIADLTVVTPHSPGDPEWQGKDTITVDALAGVSLTKTHDESGDPVAAGGSVTFTLTAANAGPSDAVGPITVVDTLPDGMTYLSAGGPWTCTAAGQQVGCTLDGDDPRIPAGGTAPALELTVRIDSTVVPGTLTNTATVTTGTKQDPNVSPDATDTVPVFTEADLSVVKSHTGTALAGTPFTWTITVTNLGPSVSRADVDHPITVTDTLPAGTTFVAAGNADFDCHFVTAVPTLSSDSPGTVTCTRTTDLAVDSPTSPAAVSFPVTVNFAPGQLDPLSNTATVTPGSTDEPEGPVAKDNNTSTDVVDVDTRADLSITKTHDPSNDTVTAGNDFPWTITVHNAGPSDSYADAATPIVITDQLPDGVLLSKAVSDDFTCTGGEAAGDGTTTAVSCQATAPLGVGDHVITLTVHVEADALGNPVDHSLTNTADITAWTTPNEGIPQTATDTVALVTSADLEVVKSHSAGEAVPGEQLSWTLQVTNHGPSVSRGTVDKPVRVTDTLPEGVTYVSATGTGWDCGAVGQLVTCLLGTAEAPTDLAVLDAPPITLVTDVTTSTIGDLTNTAEVTPGVTDDPDPKNNIDTDDPVPVTPEADLSIIKTHPAAAVRIGDPLTFTLTVANHGPSVAAKVAVGDTVPAGLTPVSATAPGWTCVIAAQQISCTLDDPGTLEPLDNKGTEQVITVVADVTAAAYPSVTNTATVRSSTPDPVSINNTASDLVTVPALADLALTKTVVGPLAVGHQGVYRLTVTNNGPTELPGAATITDTLPAGLTAVSAHGVGSASATTCTLGAVVSCTVPGPLAVGASAVVNLTVAVGPSAYPSVTNTAEVTGTTQDPNPSNNKAAVTTPVVPSAGLVVAKSLLGGGLDADGLLNWQISVTNNGPNPSVVPFTVVDTLPATLTYRSVTAGTDWSCTVSGQVVTCVFSGSLAKGETTSVTVRTTVVAAPGEAVVNQATLHQPGEVLQVAGAHFTVPIIPPPTTTPPTTTPTTPSEPDGNLPNTGVDVWPMIWTALLLLAAGGALLTGVRRQRRRGGHE